jgi:hypothetical protein
MDWRNGFLAALMVLLCYLTMGEGGSRYLHMQSIARSRSPWGPWEGFPWDRMPRETVHHAGSRLILTGSRVDLPR